MLCLSPNIQGVLEDTHLSGPEELCEAVGEMIRDSVPGCTEGDTLELCTRLFRIITGFVSCISTVYTYVCDRSFFCCIAGMAVHFKRPLMYMGGGTLNRNFIYSLS